MREKLESLSFGAKQGIRISSSELQILCFALLKIASFPRKRESIGLTMGPRFRGDDNADFDFLGWAAGP
jgi:hypothetical protein